LQFQKFQDCWYPCINTVYKSTACCTTQDRQLVPISLITTNTSTVRNISNTRINCKTARTVTCKLLMSKQAQKLLVPSMDVMYPLLPITGKEKIRKRHHSLTTHYFQLSRHTIIIIIIIIIYYYTNGSTHKIHIKSQK